MALLDQNKLIIYYLAIAEMACVNTMKKADAKKELNPYQISLAVIRENKDVVFLSSRFYLKV